MISVLPWLACLDCAVEGRVVSSSYVLPAAHRFTRSLRLVVTACMEPGTLRTRRREGRSRSNIVPWLQLRCVLCSAALEAREDGKVAWCAKRENHWTCSMKTGCAFCKRKKHFVNQSLFTLSVVARIKVDWMQLPEIISEFVSRSLLSAEESISRSASRLGSSATTCSLAGQLREDNAPIRYGVARCTGTGSRATKEAPCTHD